MSTLKVNNLKNVDGTRTLASDSGTAWSWGSGVPKGSVIEEFMSPCDGSAITVQSGTYTVQNVTAAQNGTDSHVDINGSTITYTPPTGTQTVIYKFLFQNARDDTVSAIGHYAFYIDGENVSDADMTVSQQTTDYYEGRTTFEWPINIGGSTTNTTGRQSSWTTGKTLKMTFRRYNSSHSIKLHQLRLWNGTSDSSIIRPVIGIKALA